jgi:hypothetical protein
VLLLGGVGAGGIPLASGTLYDPADGSFAPVPAMLSARILHTATLLADGRVFVAGGSAAYDLGNPIGYPGSLAAAASSTTEIYDPQSNTWAQGPALTVGRTAHQATLLPGGRVLLSGGVAFFPGGAQTVATCRLFNPTTGTLVPTAALLEPLCFHSAVATNDGGVLVAGGGVANLAALSFDETQECEIYDPAGDAAWSFGPLVPGVVGPDGRTICISRFPTGGGSLVLPFGPTYAINGGIGDIDLLDGDARSPGGIYVADTLLTAWTTSGPTVVMRPQLSVAVEQDGLRVLITGAANTPDELSAEIWVVDY